MYPLFETICVKNGVIQNIEWHEKRYKTAFELFYSKMTEKSLLEDIVVPEEFQNGLNKLRVLYNERDKKYEFERYVPKRIKTLKLVEADNVKYDLKFTDRGQLNDLLKRKENCDDVLIIKKGKITDSSYANIVFTNGRKWLTPSAPLLKGTCRQRLLSEKSIGEINLPVKDIRQFIGFNLINAMNNLDKNNFIRIDNILE
ncbi:MAG: aminotransferase class IV [Aurantibacter sp.]